MPTTLNATLEDKKIAGVKATTALKNDGIPFMLLPVRIETRFMEVDKATDNVAVQDISATVDVLVQVQIELLKIPLVDMERQLPWVIKKIIGITEQISMLNHITGKEKDMLTQMVKSFGDVQKILPAKPLKKGTTTGTDKRQEGGNAANSELTAALSNLNAAVARIKSYPLPHNTRAHAFVGAFEKAASGLEKLSNRNSIPYQNIKNKKALYTYITKTIEQAHAFYHRSPELSREIDAFPKAAYEKVSALHTGVKRNMEAVQKVLEQIHEKNKSWSQFIEKTVAPSLNTIREHSSIFEKETLNNLQRLPQPASSDARELLFTGMKALLAMHKLIAKSQPASRDLQIFKDSFSAKIDFINRVSKEKMTMNAEQEIQFKKIGMDLGGAFEEVRKKIAGYRSPDERQPYDIKGLLEYLDKNAREPVSKFGNGLEVAPVPKVQELWVRIYPDDIFVHTHEEALTVAETEAGKAFWNAWWVASNDDEAGKAAWKKLCGPFGSKRASWIANILSPVKNVTPKNTASIAAKPFANFITASNNAKDLCTKIEATDFSKHHAAYFTLTTANTIKSFSTSIINITNVVKTFSNTPTFFLDAFKVSLVRISGDIQSIRTKASHCNAQEQVTFGDRIVALDSLEADYKNLLLAVDALLPLTMEEYLTKVPVPFDYPVVPQKENSWSKAAYTYVLPDRFVVITMQGTKFTHVIVSSPVVKELQLGPDPQIQTNSDATAAYSIDAKGNLIIEEGLRWISDYPEAVKKGMAVTVPLTRKQYDDGFTKVLVLGVKESDATSSAQIVEKLFTNHAYSADGMSFLKIGTPTNNTEQAKAGYKRTDDDEDERYDIEVAKKDFSEIETNPLKISDAKRLGNSLGLSLPVLQKINNKSSTEVSNACAMNRALWHATIGHTMEEMWDHVFTYDNIKRTETFFTKYCIGRGVLPSVRIGSQPYGFLPTTAWSIYRVNKDYDAYDMPEIYPADFGPGFPHPQTLEQKREVRYYTRLQEALYILNAYWTELRIQKVLTLETLSPQDPQKDFVEMLGLNATSVEYFNRYGVNMIRQGLNADMDAEYDIRDEQGSNFIFEKFKNLMIKGWNDPSFIFDDEHPVKPIDAFKLLAAKYSRITRQLEDSRIFRNRFLKLKVELKELNGALVSSLPLSFDNSSEKIDKETYIEWLLNNDMDTLLASNNPEKFPSRSLLFLLMRQSLMQANQEAALNIFQFEKLITEDLRRITGDERTYNTYIPKVKLHRYNTKWHPLLKDIDELNTLLFKDVKPGNAFYDYVVQKTNAPAGRSSMAVYMNKPAGNPILNGWVNVAKHMEFISKVDAVREAFNVLNKIPTAELPSLLAEHLDACSYRIDTWMTGLVNKRLFEQRAIIKTGIHLGAYGWVENLKRDMNKQQADLNKIPVELKPDAGTPLYIDPDNEGFIHAPSINHAVTAAILRSAYTANSAEENINNRLSVNISSSRVRMALNLIDGVQNGLPIGALLGFQFEKGLHERYQTVELDKYILPFRKMFPLVVPVKDNGQPGKAPAYNSNVLNGTGLLNKIFDEVKWMDFPSKDTLFQVLMTKKASLTWLTGIVGFGTEYEQVAREIDRMADAFDALGDLAISESVYQIVNGNHVRAAAMVSSLASGKNIPDPQIVDTVRTGTVITQRVLLNLEVKTVFANPVNWGFGATPRSKAEPSLNNWLAGIIGDPSTIQSLITYNDGNMNKTEIISLSDLKIQPVDYLFLWANEADVTALIEFSFRKKFPAIPTKTKVVVDIKSRLGNWPDNIRTFNETSLLLQELRSLMQIAKPAGADSYSSPVTKLDEANPGSVMDAEILNRINASKTEMKAAITAVTADAFVKDLLDKKKVLGAPNQPTALTLPQLTLVSNFLTAASLYGIQNSIPRTVFAAGDDLVPISKDLVQQATPVYEKLKLNIKNAEAILTKITAKSTPKEKAGFCLDAFKALFGKLFLALPLFQSLNAGDISQQLLLPAIQSLLRNGGPLAMQDWMHGVSKVRKAMQSIQMIDMVAMGMNNLSFPIQPAQLPYTANDYWAGAEYPKAYSLDGDKLSLVLIYPDKWLSGLNTQHAGLVCDEWMEIIPNKTETTGIVLNYNQPDAVAPQTVLLAVTPKETGHWVWEDLVHTLLDTLEMAKNRAVEPDHLQDSALSHILPTILAEVAPQNSEDANALGVQAAMDFDFNREEKENVLL